MKNNPAPKERIIFHIDCNAFYASVEEVSHPEFKKVPMAICGDPESRRGIILAKNQIAKNFGVKTAETIWQARKKCPSLVLRPARHHVYRQYCEQINAIYEQYTDRVERFGIDESYLDLTESLHLFGGDALKLAHDIRMRVARETGITVSVGVSFNKIFAKLASDMKKPNAVTLISRDNYRKVAWPLPSSALLMVGKSTEKALQNMYIHTIGDLARAHPAALKKRLGKSGELLHIYANGLDDSRVLCIGDSLPPHSVGNGITFRRDLVSAKDIQTALTALADRVASRLRKANMKCATLQLTIKDTNLKVITRQRPAPFPLWLSSDIAAEAFEILQSSWKIGVPIRMMAVTGQNLIPSGEAKEQLSFFLQDEQMKSRNKREKIEQTVDHIRDLFGSGSILPGSILQNGLGIYEKHEKEDE